MNNKEVIKKKVYGKPRLMTMTGLGFHCPGCQYGVLEQMVCEVIDEMGIQGNTIGIGGVGCCYAFFMFVDIDAMNCPHGVAPAVASAIKRAHENAVLLTVQGDGDTLAIGAGPLLNAAARAEKITVILVNNGNYGTTGGQLAPTTLIGQVTSTTPEGRDESTGYPMHAPELLAGIKGVAYAARGALNTPANYKQTRKYLKKALQKQIDDVGFSFLEVLSTCPPDWHMTPLEALDWVEQKMIPEYPLGEFKNIDQIV